MVGGAASALELYLSTDSMRVFDERMYRFCADMFPLKRKVRMGSQRTFSFAVRKAYGRSYGFSFRTVLPKVEKKNEYKN